MWFPAPEDSTKNTGISQLTPHPPRAEEEKTLYQLYFGSFDSRIEKEFRAFSNQNSAMAFSQMGHRPGSEMEPPYSGDSARQLAPLRAAIAQGVLKLRIDSTLNFFSAAQQSTALRGAHQAFEGLKDQKVAVSQNPQGPQLQLGYDIYSDESRLELSQNTTIGLGVFQAHFLGGFSGARPWGQFTQIRFRTKPLASFPEARFTYHLAGVIEAHFRQALSKGLISEVLLTQPTEPGRGWPSQTVRFIFDL